MAPQSQATANLIAVLSIFIVVEFSQIANSMPLNGSSSHSGIKKPLRIAHVGGLNVEIPPKNVGGLEKVVEVLMFEQIRAGHHVTLFCTKDSGDMEAQRKKYGISEEQLKNHFRLIPSSRKSLHLHTRNYEEYVQKVKPFVPYLKEFQQEIIRHVENGEFDVVVIAPRTGSVPEVVLKNAGLIFDIDSRIVDGEKRVEYSERTIEEAAKLVDQADQLDRQKVRRVFEEHFSVKVMTGGYEKIYEKIVASRVEERKKKNEKEDLDD